MTLNAEQSDIIIQKLKKHYGEVKADLRFDNLYQLTIAVVLSAQTTDRQVNSVTEQLFKDYPDFASLAAAKRKDIEEAVYPTGFYRNKAANIIKLAKTVQHEFKGKLPQERESLEKLKGVGRKSANVILSIGFGIPAIAVDTHVTRISNRLEYVSSKSPLQTERALMNIIPERQWTDAHLLFIRHGRETCKARTPLCSECPIADLCRSSDKIP